MQTLLHLKELDLFVWVDEMGYIETLPKYKLRKNGRKDNRRGKIIKPAKDRYGYLRATFSNNNKRKSYYVHRLVAMAYLPNYDDKLQVNHKDGNKLNNNRLNLEMVTLQENIKHSIETGLKPQMERDRFGKFKCKKGLIYAFDCNRVCDNTKRGDLGDRKVNPSVAKTISCRGAESQRADVTNFVVGDNSVEYTLGEIRDKINKFRDIKEPVACELRCDEGIRTFKDNIMGTLRTIEACGDKAIIEPTLKEQLCDRLVESGLLKVGTVINHSYTNGLNGKNPNSRQTLEDYIESENGICNCLTTRPDVLGIAVEDLTTKNKRLANMVDKIDPNKCQAIDIYNQSVHEEMHTIKTNIDRANMTAITQNLRIRKLTPKECFRLMGVRDENFKLIERNQSRASLYHLAGDSIVVTVLVAILSHFVDGFDFNRYILEFYKQIKENEDGNIGN